MSSEATESNWEIAFNTWLVVNQRRLLIGAGVIIFGAFAYSTYSYLKNQKEADASNALIALLPGMDTSAPATKPAEFVKVAENYAGTAAAERAMLLAAQACVAEGNYQEAKTRFEQFLSGNASGPLAATATLGVAVSLDALNDTDKAIATYQKVISSFGSDTAAAQARLALAVLYETKNQPAQALRLYEELSARPTAWMGEAMFRKNQLLTQHPELASTNLPPDVAAKLQQAFKAQAQKATNAAPQVTPTAAPKTVVPVKK